MGMEGGRKGTRRPPGGKRLSVDDGDRHGHGLGPPPRSRPRPSRRHRIATMDGAEAVAERRVIADYSAAARGPAARRRAGAIAMPAARSGGAAEGIDRHKTDKPSTTEGEGRKVGWKKGREQRKSAVIRGENILGNSLENFLGKR